jgi:hypothetical protein
MAFALIDANELALTLQIVNGQPNDFTDPQARGVCGHEEGTVFGSLVVV